MASKPRLTLASMWAFEDIGVKDIQAEFKKSDPQLDCSCEYLKVDDALVIKGHPEGAASKFASVMSDFIEDQKNKDLLDMPRIRQLEIPVILGEDTGAAIIGVEKDQEGDLLALDDGCDEEVIPHVLNHTTKFWLSPRGGLGCFSEGHHEILAELAAMTGTEISVVDDIKGVQISGKNSGDVDDAFSKLNRIEKPLSFMGNPRVANMAIAPEGDGIRLRIQNYSNLNSVALSRILTDPNSTSNASLSQVYITALLSFDANTQSFNLPEALLNPPSIGKEPGKSRIWSDFTFPEIGKGESFLSMDLIVEKDPTDPKTVTCGIAPPHPFLTAEKANRVNQWVVEGATTEREAGTESNEPSRPVTPPQIPESAPAPADKKPPGIRTRKAVQAVKEQPATPVKAKPVNFSPEAEPAKTPNDEDEPTPRKKWKMRYEQPGPENLPKPSQEVTSQAAATEKESIAAILTESPVNRRPRTPENITTLPIAFDATKYGLKTPKRAGKSTPPKFKVNENTPPKLKAKGNTPPTVQRDQRHSNKNQLIDIFAPVDQGNTNSHPLIFFDQPALIPQNSSSSPSQHEKDPFAAESSSQGKRNATDLLGLIENNMSSSSDESDPALDQRSSSQTKLSGLGNGARLTVLMSLLADQKQNAALQARPSKSSRQINQDLAAERLAELEKAYKSKRPEKPEKPEEKQSVDEASTRVFHRTMGQKTTRPGEKQSVDETSTREFHRTMIHEMAKAKDKAKRTAEIKAKRQATLEDAWGMPKKASNKQLVEPVITESKASEKPKPKPKIPEALAVKQAAKISQQQQEEANMNQGIRNIFEALKPTLEAAEYFPGTLSLEVQFGIILIPLLPKSYGEGFISLNEWTRIFQPRNGLPPPTTKFVNRLTTSGTDVDHLVDLKASKAEGKQRLFEQEYSEYSVSYEFHCRTNTDQLFVVTIDDQGKDGIKNATTSLGAVNLHFPKQTWDASIVVNGLMEHATSSNQELEEAIKYLVDNLWVQPDRSLIRIFTRLPKGNKFVIEKVFMKRWTRHRYIRPGDVQRNTTDTAPSTPVSRSTAATPKEESIDDNNSTTTESDNNESQDISLQIMEVQDLFIGSSASDPQAVRARCAPLPEMVKRGRQWYEASLISPAIEAILKSNASVEVGERTDDWCSSDLLGEDGSLLSDNATDSQPPPWPLSSVAAAIGKAGLGGLFRLTKTVVEKSDGIGFWNIGPGVEAARLTAATANGPLALPAPPPAGSGSLAKVEQKSMDFDDLESIKEVGSVVNGASVKKSSMSTPIMEQVEGAEEEYW